MKPQFSTIVPTLALTLTLVLLLQTVTPTSADSNFGSGICTTTQTSPSAVFELVSYDVNDAKLDGDEIVVKLWNLFGINKKGMYFANTAEKLETSASPFVVQFANSTNAPAWLQAKKGNTTCPGRNTSTGCFHFSLTVASDAKKRNSMLNRVNYTLQALEAMISQLFRNSSNTAGDGIETLGALNWDTVIVHTSSCSTQNAVNILTQDYQSLVVNDPDQQASDDSHSSSGSMQVPPKCNQLQITGSSSSLCSSQSNNATSALLTALSAATASSNWIFLGNAACGPCCFGSWNSTLVQQTRLRVTAISRAVDATVLRNDNTKIDSDTEFKIVVPDGCVGGYYASSSAVSKSKSNVVAPSQYQSALDGTLNFAFSIPFDCGSSSSSSSLFQTPLGNANNASTLLVQNFPTTFSFAPFEGVTGINNNNTRVFLNVTSSNSAASAKGRRKRMCAVILYAWPTDQSLSNNNNKKNGIIDDKLFICARRWAQAGATPLDGPQPKKQTPPLMLISLIATAVVWILVCAYVWKFAPKTRRFDFPHQGLAEAMLGSGGMKGEDEGGFSENKKFESPMQNLREAVEQEEKGGGAQSAYSAFESESASVKKSTTAADTNYSPMELEQEKEKKHKKPQQHEETKEAEGKEHVSSGGGTSVTPREEQEEKGTFAMT